MKTHPKPHPLVKKAAKSATTSADVIQSEPENGEVTAAHAFITLQNRNHTGVNSHPIKNHVHATVNLYLSSDEEKEDEQDQLEDDVEEVDELDNDTDDYSEFMQQ